jgi:hypothetical protein
MSERAEIFRPGQDGYTEACRVFNLAAPVRPAAATVARTPGQVRDAVRMAEAAGLGVRVQATGHAAGAARPMQDALLVRTELAGTVEVDPDRRRARIPAGTLWGDVVDAVTPHGLAAPHGSAGTVGAVGYLLRGGLSFYGRWSGLAVNSVRAVDLVTADGELRRVDDVTDPELFWAVRGGGGGFGVVTAVEIELFPVAGVVTGAAFWPVRHASRLLKEWQAWTADAPAQASTSVRVMNLPKVPEVPPELSAGPVVCIDGVVLAETAADTPVTERLAEDLLGPLRAVAEPLIDSWQPTELRAVLQAHLDPPDPVPFLGDHFVLGDIGDDGAGEFLRLVDAEAPSPLVAVGLRQLGGAYAHPDPLGGALSHVDGSFAFSTSGAPGLTGTREEIELRCATLRDRLAHWDTGTTVPSFVEDHRAPQRHLDEPSLATVDRVRDRIDPEGLFAGDVMPGSTAR